MNGQPASVSVLKRTVATVLFSTLTHCLGSTGGLTKPRRVKITDSNWMKPSIVYMYYTHSGYRTSIFGKIVCIIFEFLIFDLIDFVRRLWDRHCRGDN